jgi:hypothetical protein
MKCALREVSVSIVDDAMKAPAVDALYKEIAAQGSIAFEDGKDGEQWASKTVSGVTTITVTPTVHPAASLYHELLHAKLKLAGYRQYTVWASMDGGKRDWLKPIGEALDNELQHARMSDEFLRAGFRPEEFYHDDDTDAFKHARRGLQGLRKTELPEKFLLPFMTVIAPLGFGSDDDRRKLRNMFKANSSDATWAVLTGIEDIFARWRENPSLDPGDSIVAVLRLLGGYDRTWVGTSQQEFPQQGRFVGLPFTAQELLAWHARQRQ